MTTETSVVIARESYPNGRTVGTYSRVEVATGSPAPTPTAFAEFPSDPYWLDQQLRAKALGHGLTSVPVAGYLYFRQSGKRRKSDTAELKYSNAEGSFGMPFPK
jgi:hypothetical protein